MNHIKADRPNGKWAHRERTEDELRAKVAMDEWMAGRRSLKTVARYLRLARSAA